MKHPTIELLDVLEVRHFLSNRGWEKQYVILSNADASNAAAKVQSGYGRLDSPEYRITRRGKRHIW